MAEQTASAPLAGSNTLIHSISHMNDPWALRGSTPVLPRRIDRVATIEHVG